MVNEDNNHEDEWIDLRKREPQLLQLIEESLNEIKEPPGLQKKLLLQLKMKKDLLNNIDTNTSTVTWLSLLSYQRVSVGLVTMITVGFLIGIYYFVYNTNSAKNTDNLPLISKNENPDPKYRNSNPINNLTMIEIATIVYIEKSENENENKLINNIAKKLSENSKKSISMDKDIAYEIILNIKINENIVTVNIGDVMDNILFSKEYDITDKSLEEMANIISTNLLTECKLK